MSRKSKAAQQQMLAEQLALQKQCASQKRMLDRNDADLAAAMDLNRSLHAVKQALLRGSDDGELILLDLGQGSLRLAPDGKDELVRATIVESNNNDPSSAAKNHPQQQQQQQQHPEIKLEAETELPQLQRELCVDFLLRRKLRRKLLSRVARRTNRLAASMDGNADVPAPPKYGDLRLQCDTEYVLREVRQVQQRQEEALRQMEILREQEQLEMKNPAAAAAAAKSTSKEEAEEEEEEDKSTKDEDGDAKMEDAEKEKSAVEPPAATLSSPVKAETAEGTEEKADEPEKLPIASIDYAALKDYKDVYEKRVLHIDDPDEYPTYRILEPPVSAGSTAGQQQQPPPPLPPQHQEDHQILKGAGIGATHHSMSAAEKQMEFKRWQTTLLARIPEQPTYADLGLEHRVFLTDERRKRALEKMEKAKKVAAAAEAVAEKKDEDADDDTVSVEPTPKKSKKEKDSDSSDDEADKASGDDERGRTKMDVEKKKDNNDDIGNDDETGKGPNDSESLPELDSAAAVAASEDTDEMDVEEKEEDDKGNVAEDGSSEKKEEESDSKPMPAPNDDSRKIICESDDNAAGAAAATGEEKDKMDVGKKEGVGNGNVAEGSCTETKVGAESGCEPGHVPTDDANKNGESVDSAPAAAAVIDAETGKMDIEKKQDEKDNGAEGSEVAEKEGEEPGSEPQLAMTDEVEQKSESVAAAAAALPKATEPADEDWVLVEKPEEEKEKAPADKKGDTDKDDTMDIDDASVNEGESDSKEKAESKSDVNKQKDEDDEASSRNGDTEKKDEDNSGDASEDGEDDEDGEGKGDKEKPAPDGAASAKEEEGKNGEKKKVEEEIQQAPKIVRPISLAPIPSFFEQDLRRIRAVQSDLLTVSVVSKAQRKLNEVVEEYNTALRTAFHLHKQRSHVQQHLNALRHEMNNQTHAFKDQYSIQIRQARNQWHANRLHFEKEKMDRLLPSRNGMNLTGTQMTQTYSAHQDRIGVCREVGYCLADIVDAVDNVAQGRIQNHHFTEPFIAPPPPSGLDPEFLNKSKQMETAKSNELNALTLKYRLAEEERSRAWKKLLKVKSDHKMQQKLITSSGTYRYIQLDPSNYQRFPVPNLQQCMLEEVQQMGPHIGSISSFTPAPRPTLPSKEDGADASKYCFTATRKRVAAAGVDHIFVSKPKEVGKSELEPPKESLRRRSRTRNQG